MSEIDDQFLQLIKLGIGAGTICKVPASTNWEQIKTLADHHGLLAIVADGFEQLPDSQRPPKELLLQWIGEVFQGYEYRYDLYCHCILELADFYNNHGFKMMVLKGYACSLDWPKPEHRPCGDIDIWQFGRQKAADAAIAKEKRIKVDNSEHHHTVFCWRDFMVENHFDFVNTKDLQSSKSIEKILKELGKDDSHDVELKDASTSLVTKVYVPSPNLHALFLMRHLLLHFVSTSINLRQVLDWGFFVKAHSSEVDWDWLFNIMDEYNMREFLNCINVICVEKLGFDASFFPRTQVKPFITERVLEDILHPKYEDKEPKWFIPRLIYKFRRWQGNAWKQRACYNEGRMEVFLRGLWAHILRPSSL